MIFDRLNNLGRYIPADYISLLYEFISQAENGLPNGYYEIDYNHIFAKIMEYETKRQEDCKAESHNRYIDIQITLRGAEGISVFENNEKLICNQCNETEDVCFYEVGEIEPSAIIRNLEGVFCILFPSEVHRPQELVGEKESIKKLVIKMEAALWQK